MNILGRFGKPRQKVRPRPHVEYSVSMQGKYHAGKLVIDGVDVSRSVTAARFLHNARGETRLHITVIPDTVYIDADDTALTIRELDMDPLPAA